jgi:phosphate starvation-inducible PhoH-like protein
MKAFMLSPALLLFSSFGMNHGFYKPTISAILKGVGIDKSTLYKNNIPETFQILDSKRRKDIEDFVVDGIIDSTKKLLYLEEELAAKSNKQRKIKTIQPKTDNQRAFLELMREDAVDIIIAIGPAGTGKTMLACYAAVEALRLGKVNKIVVTRPVVSVDEEIGFLPGGLESKMDPWTRPIFDTLRETYSAKEIERMTEEGVIEIVPLGFMRGRTFKNAWIIADEMQNSSPTQMFMLATRIGEGSKMIITGDLNQSDLNPKCNGLLEIYQKIQYTERTRGLDCVRYIELDKEDVQRSRAAKTILGIYEPEDIHEPEDIRVLIESEEESMYEQSELTEGCPNSTEGCPNSTEGCSNSTEGCSNSTEGCSNSTEDQKSSSPFPSSPPSSPTKRDWIEIGKDVDNDAALIPLRHIQKRK